MIGIDGACQNNVFEYAPIARKGFAWLYGRGGRSARAFPFEVVDDICVYVFECVEDEGKTGEVSRATSGDDGERVSSEQRPRGARSDHNKPHA